MKRHSATLQGFLLTLLMIPYLLVVTGALSNYIAFSHRFSFQAQVASSLREDLKTLTLSTSEFKKIKWIEEGKEFEYHEKMYDVAKIEKQGTNFVISCESDSLEDLFISLLKSVGKSKSKMIPQIQFSQPIDELEIKMSTVMPEKTGWTPTNFYSSFLSEIIPPPPRVS